MKCLQVERDWLKKVLPEGLPLPSSTLLSGPGGSGKPLIGNVIVASWLRQGGSVIFMSLQYPDHSFIAAGLKKVAHLDLQEYSDRVAFIELDATIEDMTPSTENRFKANVVKPKVWDKAIQRACAMVPEEGPGILIFISAVNLLLFSPTYGEAILQKMMTAVQQDSPYTYLLSASTTAKGEEISKLEKMVDNLVMTRSTQSPFRLYMKILRVKGAPFVSEEIEVPISPDVLTDVKEIADHSRKRVIPLVRKL